MVGRVDGWIIRALRPSSTDVSVHMYSYLLERAKHLRRRRRELSKYTRRMEGSVPRFLYCSNTTSLCLCATTKQSTDGSANYGLGHERRIDPVARERT